MTKLLPVIISIILLVSVGAAGQKKKETRVNFAPVEKFDPKRDAAKDIRNACKEAKLSKRKVLLDIGGEWCIWCRRLDTFFIKNKDVAEYLHKNYVVVKVNYSEENKNEKVLLKYPEIPGYPHFFVLNADGSLLHSQETGELEAGKGHDHDKVLAFLKKWAGEKKE